MDVSKRDKVFIAVAPNGARRGKADNPAIPLTTNELAMEAESWVSAGVSMVHLHVRDVSGKHSLNAGLYRQAIAGIREQVGDRIVIQITTEAVGKYTPEDQMAVVREVQPESASVSIREITSTGLASSALYEFYSWAKKSNVLVQHVIYTLAELEKFRELVALGTIPGRKHVVIVALGQYDKSIPDLEMESRLESFASAFRESDLDLIWFVCSFGKREAQTVLNAVLAGGHVRIGFENNIWLPDGRLADSNQTLIKQVSDQLTGDGCHIGNAQDLRDVFRAVIAS